MHLPQLISDLALMLIVAGIVILIFKKLKQPLVLGYIVAGFLTGPFFHLIPSVVDSSSIHTWSEIGVIFLMFFLGLEFNLHKLASTGGTAIITAIVEVCGMLAVGFVVGQAMGWNTMNSVFLGGILAMSSTTIIVKAFEELNLRGKKFTDLVFGVLIVEDIVGIFMMIILSTIAVSTGITGLELAQSLSLMLLYLAMWLFMGIYLIPTALKKLKNLMNNETLLIVSIGLCLGMVLLAVYLGFSSALGAFLAGSILAGTNYAEKIEHLTKPVKDLFGAVFFISVGMLVDPALLAKYWIPIVLITIATILGKLIFSTSGMLLSGQSLETALHGGFSLAQIGEFAFIITALGSSLGVTGDFLYPIIVSVSVITTFTTPFCIRLASPLYNSSIKILPKKWIKKLNRFTSEEQGEREKESEWRLYIRKYFKKLILYSVLILGFIYAGTEIFLPLLRNAIGNDNSRIVILVFELAIVAIFLPPLLQRKDKSFTSLWMKTRFNHLPLIVLSILKLLIAIILVELLLNILFDMTLLSGAIIALVLIAIAFKSDWLIGFYLTVEARFMSNFNERKLKERAEAHKTSRWLDAELFVQHVNCKDLKDIDKKHLEELRWPELFGVLVIKILRDKHHINIPPAREIVHNNDEIILLGTKEHLNRFNDINGLDTVENHVTLHQFIDEGQDDYSEKNQLLTYTVTVTNEMDFVNRSIKAARINHKWKCLLIGLEREQYPQINPNLDMHILANDFIWIIGDQRMIRRLAHDDLLEFDAEEEDEAD